MLRLALMPWERVLHHLYGYLSGWPTFLDLLVTNCMFVGILEDQVLVLVLTF